MACGDSGGRTAAHEQGIGTSCATDTDCSDENACITGVAGGYCAPRGCAHHHDCPRGSSCVTHGDGQNYCFLSCQNKSTCNLDRSADVEANCSSNVTFTEETTVKACVPPSSGE